ncbi:alcohol dehydrogenase [Corticicoccus populi]|uniref:Alcohol dehydrogenase n=1 Tax=Corticicoccus populi TaxID=1812821 RepID=A0ABW5X098_9STAP
MSVKDFVNKLKPKAQNCCSVEIEEKKTDEKSNNDSKKEK